MFNVTRWLEASRVLRRALRKVLAVQPARVDPKDLERASEAWRRLDVELREAAGDILAVSKAVDRHTEVADGLQGLQWQKEASDEGDSDAVNE